MSDKFQIGEYWLSQQRGSPHWYATWRAPGRTKRASLAKTGKKSGLDTTDFEQAKEALADWIATEVRTKDAAPADVRLAPLLVRYLEEVADKKPSASQNRYCAGFVADHYGLLFLNEITTNKQRDVLRTLHKEKGFSVGTLNRIQAALSAALGYARQENEIIAAPKIILSKAKIADIVEAGEKEPERRLSMPELAELIDAIESEHVFRYVILAITTAARPDAITDLMPGPGQLNFNDKLIRLNPPGRYQTKKFRPVIPMAKVIERWIPLWISEDADAQKERGKIGPIPLVNYHGKPVENPKKAIRVTAMRAKLMKVDDMDMRRNVTPYTLRRTVGRVLRQKHVPMADIAAFMGHKMRGFDTTEIYADPSPDFLEKPKEAIDSMIRELNKLTKRALLPQPQAVKADQKRTK